jgi:hypothetical protein
MVLVCIHFACYVIYFLAWGESESTVCPIVPAPDDDDNDECGAVGGVRITRGS